MVIELPERLEPALKVRADANGVSVEVYVREVVERDLAPLAAKQKTTVLTGAALVDAMQASPYKEIEFEPTRDRLPVRPVVF